MEMTITLAGGDRILAGFDNLTIVTDQDKSAPSPFDLFLASIGTCAGFYVSSFCRGRGIPTAGITIRQRMEPDASGTRVERIVIEVRLPEDFPEKYRNAVLRAAGSCSVKKHLEAPPTIELRAVTGA